MKKVFFLFILAVAVVLACSSCVSARKNSRSLESLMLQDNTKLRTNRAYYSHHNTKTKRDAYRKYRKNRR